jgi:hypothetical protein
LQLPLLKLSEGPDDGAQNPIENDPERFPEWNDVLTYGNKSMYQELLVFPWLADGLKINSSSWCESAGARIPGFFWPSGEGELLGADAEEFVFPQGFDLRFAGGHHGEGISHRIEDLQLVAWFLAGTSLVVFDNGRQIAATEIFLRQVIGKRNSGEERVFHGLSGYSVMKWV